MIIKAAKNVVQITFFPIHLVLNNNTLQMTHLSPFRNLGYLYFNL